MPGIGWQRGLESAQDKRRGILVVIGPERLPPEEVEEREDRAELPHSAFKRAAGGRASNAKTPRQDQARLVKATACLLPRIPREENKNL